MGDKKLIDLLVEDNQAGKVTLMGVDIFASQLTLEDQSKVQAMFPDEGDSAKRQASYLIMKCKDAEGRPHFTSDDRDALVAKVGAGRFAKVWKIINGESVDAQAEK